MANKNKKTASSNQTPSVTGTSTVIVSETTPAGAGIPLPQTTTQGAEVVANPAPRAQRKRYTIDMEKFCTEYNQATSLEDAAKRTGMDQRAVSSRAQYYKNVGVSDGKGGKIKLALKSFRGQTPRNVDVAALNERLRAIAAGQQAPVASV